MRRFWMLACCLLVGVVASIPLRSQSRGPSVVIYEGERLIVGDGSAPIEGAAFVVQNGRITALGRKGAVSAPAGAAHVDLTGKTVMPAMVNAHVHFGYERFTKAEGEARAENFTPENLLDHLQREAFYGVGTANDGGSASVPISLQFQLDQAANNFPGAARFYFNAGIVPPNGGPDSILIKGTRPLHANYEVLRATEARAAVQDVNAKNIKHVKVWLGDRGGNVPRDAARSVRRGHRRGAQARHQGPCARDDACGIRKMRYGPEWMCSSTWSRTSRSTMS